jgi:hypothetical protein
MNELQNNLMLNGFKALTPAAASQIDYSQLKSNFNEQNKIFKQMLSIFHERVA